MSNSYYAPSGNNKAIPGNTVRSAQFNGNNELVEQAFDLLPQPDDLITSRQNFVVSSGVTPNLYEITLPGITVLKDGMAIAFKAHKANTGPVSVKVNGAFTRTVKNSVRAPLLAGDLIVDTIALLRYDNTNGEFQMANAISNVADEVERARLYATNSQASATASATSASASEVSRQASAASASDANVSRAAAAISAQNAAQSLTDIYARYLGSRTTYFTQRPDGSPLTGGELMFLATAVNAGRGLYYYDFIDTSWKPSSDPQVATLVSALQTIMSQHIGVGGSLSHPNVTATVTGFMSSADKVKLDGVATAANNYVHPVGDGNSHVPATGTTSANKVLTAGGTAGSFSWQTPPIVNGVHAGKLTVVSDDTVIAIKNAVAGAASYLTSQDNTGAPRWILGNAGSNSSEVSLHNPVNNSSVDLGDIVFIKTPTDTHAFYAGSITCTTQVVGQERAIIRGAVEPGSFDTWRQRAVGLQVDCRDIGTAASTIWRATQWGVEHLASLQVYGPARGALAVLTLRDTTHSFLEDGTFRTVGPGGTRTFTPTGDIEGASYGGSLVTKLAGMVNDVRQGVVVQTAYAAVPAGNLVWRIVSPTDCFSRPLQKLSNGVWATVTTI